MSRLTVGWAPDPFALLGLLAAGLAYALGLRRLWASAGRGAVVRPWQAWAFTGALAVLALALVSPLDALGDELMAGHMAQHLAVQLVAAPLLVVAAPLQTVAWGLTPRGRRRLGRLEGRVARAWRGRGGAGVTLVTAVWIGVLYLWHVPALYDAAVRLPWLHEVEHATQLAAALAFWAAVVAPRRYAAWRGLAALFASAVACGLLAALITFAPAPWLASYTTSAARWGLTPLADQQLAGAVLWVPGGVVHLAAAALLFSRWLQQDAADVARREARTVEHGKRVRHAG